MHLTEMFLPPFFISVHRQGPRPRHDPLLQTIQIHPTLATERQPPGERWVL